MREKLLSLEEYEALPESDLYRDELSRGRLVREPAPGARHGDIVANLTYLLRSYLEQQPVGKALTESGFLLDRAAAVVRRPDVAFVRAVRVPGELSASFFDGAPDLAIEVVSPSNRPSNLLQKIAELLAAGTQRVWVVYPQTRTVAEHTSEGDLRIYNGEEVLTAPDLLPGFMLPVARVFV
jgi:Uma2 family endonuclease